ncbi:MAG TPA: antibiotic biosynthesis monooxygenase [Casimicrobiaceae bacterium]|jgi:quinol monooxygenase YgiN
MLKLLIVFCLATATLVVDASGSARAQTPAGNVTVVTIIDVLSNANIPQNVESASALLDKLAADARQSPGVVSFKILREASRANHFIILGVWKDIQSFEAYSGAETTRAFRQAFQPRLGGPFDERIYIDLK